MAGLTTKFTEEASGLQFFGQRGGAGCLVMAQSTGRFLIAKRGPDVMEPHTWGTWGGAIEEGSNARRTVADELYEETGYDNKMRLEPLYTFRSPGGKFTYENFLVIVPDEFTPWDAPENEDHRWVALGDWPEPLHFGLRALISDVPAMRKMADFAAQAQAGADLLKGAPWPERTLYHCLYKDPEGDALRPLSERDVNGRTDKYLFATHSLTMALAYSFSYHDRKEMGGNGNVPGTPDEYAFVCTRDETMGKPRNTRVFSFSSKGFEPMGNPTQTRQWVSTEAVPFDRTHECFETKDVHDLMRHGLQILSIETGPEEFYSSGAADKYWNIADVPTRLATMVRDGVARWENWERRDEKGQPYNPNGKIAAALGVDKAPGPAKPVPGPQR